mmetsp:Transcript_38463/g.88786  ORF Transcript_38463/g.88786 Transcript_38463/m.88786 type:complete len:88 (-) Transcript_38463:2253-2516(-)
MSAETATTVLAAAGLTVVDAEVAILTVVPVASEVLLELAAVPVLVDARLVDPDVLEVVVNKLVDLLVGEGDVVDREDVLSVETELEL